MSELKSKNKGNSALVLLSDSEVAKQYFGGAQEGLDENTLFPTASFSTWVTALSVMSLVESHQLDLDAPVSRYLTRWQLPDSEFNNDEVTISRLLSHSARLTDQLGFGDYAADEVVPAVKVILSGNDGIPLKTATIEAMRKPYAFVMGSGIWGLGTILYAPSPNGDYVFGHDGANDPAINSAVRLNPETSDGIVLLVSGHPSLASHIDSEWVLWQTDNPDFLQTERALKSAVLPILVGTLQIISAFFLWSRRRSQLK